MEKLAVRAVRGATTVEENNAEMILDATRELLERITVENDIAHEDIISIVFSMTCDLDAVFPAVAARQLGWTDIAMMCFNEINVPGSLEKCIRVMMHINTEKSNNEIRYVYLNDAVKLRPDLFEQSDNMGRAAIGKNKHSD